MIILNRTNELIVPRVDRCKNDPCNIYQLVMQNKATKEIVIFKLRDYACYNPIYFQFRFNIPEWFKYGEYDVYLIKNNDWQPPSVNEDNICNSCRKTDKSVIGSEGLKFIAGNTLIVTSLFKAKLVDVTESRIKSNGLDLIAYTKSSDNRPAGEIWTYLDVIHTDLAKYKPSKEANSSAELTRSKQRRKYIEHIRK